MRIHDSVRLACQATSSADGRGLLLGMAAGKRVLNVGAGGGVVRYLPRHESEWLHAQLAQVAASLDGVDIDSEAVRHAAEHGWQIWIENCEDMTLSKSYDLIVVSDVIEHLERPQLALCNLVQHLEPGGQVVVTTPNATFVGMQIKALLNRDLSVFWDHTQLYAPEHVQAICDRHGLRLKEIVFFSTQDLRSRQNKIKSRIMSWIGSAAPRLHNSFLAIISDGKGLQAGKDLFK